MLKLKSVTSIILLFVVMCFAQVPDTVHVAPGNGTLNDAVNDEANHGKVFKLQSGPDAIYIMTEDIVNNGWHLIVEGEDDDKVPPQLIRDSDSNKIYPFTVEGDITLKNLWVHNTTLSGIWGKRAIIRVVEDSIDVTIDNVISSGGRGYFVHLENAAMVNLKVTNCLYYNSFSESSVNSGGRFVWIQGAHTGSYYIANNTVFNTTGPAFLNHDKVFDVVENVVVEHNTIVLTSRQVFEVMEVLKSYTIKNNLFVDGYVRAVVDSGLYQGVDYAGDYMAGHDSWREGNETEGFFPVDTLAVEWGIDETERDIQIHHNVRFDTPKILNWHADNNVWNIPWLTATGQEMFDAYPNFTFENNVEGIDPLLTTPLTEDQYDKVIAWQDANRTSQEMPTRSWYPDDDEDPFTNPWPLPIDFSFDYEQTYATEGYHLAGDDGYPVGDLNWFPELKEKWENGDAGTLTPISLSTAVEDEQAMVIDDFQLKQNYPNPFNPVTTINYSLNKNAAVTLTVYNTLGQAIKTLVNAKVQAGNHSVVWDGTDEYSRSVGSGIYYCQIQSNDLKKNIKMVLVR